MKINKAKIKYYLKEAIFVLITMLIVANIMSYYKSRSLLDAPLQEKSFQLLDKTTYHLDPKRPVIIHFWATWCPVCKVETSNINLLSKYFQVITIAVKSGDDKEILAYLKAHNYDYPVVNDSSGIIAAKYHIAAFPTTFIYDKNRQLIFSEVGYTSTIGLFLRAWWTGF